jgi:hypothetical protein
MPACAMLAAPPPAAADRGGATASANNAAIDAEPGDSGWHGPIGQRKTGRRRRPGSMRGNAVIVTAGEWQFVWQGTGADLHRADLTAARRERRFISLHLERRGGRLAGARAESGAESLTGGGGDPDLEASAGA